MRFFGVVVNVNLLSLLGAAIVGGDKQLSLIRDIVNCVGKRNVVRIQGIALVGVESYGLLNNVQIRLLYHGYTAFRTAVLFQDAICADAEYTEKRHRFLLIKRKRSD